MSSTGPSGQKIILEVQDFAEDAFDALKSQLSDILGDAWEENKNKFRAFAKHVGLLNYNIFMGKRVDTAASALEDVLKVGIPMLRIELRYQLEDEILSTVFASLSGFFSGVLTIAISAGKSYLEQESLDLLGKIGDEVSTWRI